GEHRGAGGLRDQVDEVDGGEEVRRRQPEDDDDEDLADDDRDRAEVPRAEVQPGALRQPGEPARDLLFLERRGAVGADDVRGCHTGASAEGIPATLVGTPAVIASTTACWVVVLRSKTPTFLPRRSTVMRSAVSKTSWRLCEMRMTPRPW